MNIQFARTVGSIIILILYTHVQSYSQGYDTSRLKADNGITNRAQTGKSESVAKTEYKLNFYNRFSEYEPNYFITNFAQKQFGQVKFQISFKYDLGFFFHQQEDTLVKDKIYFAYTQDAYWNIYDYSAPMLDMNYAPQLQWQHFINAEGDKKGDRAKFRMSYFKLGGSHRSNGGFAGVNNRSEFRLFAHTNFTWDINRTPSHSIRVCQIQFYPQAWILPKSWLADENKDLAKYIGYGRFITSLLIDVKNAHYGDTYPVEISNTLIPSTYLSDVVAIKVNPHLPSAWSPFIYLEYWYGYGESLLNYDNDYYYNRKAENIVRLGVQFRIK